jgi:hypothetical protein
MQPTIHLDVKLDMGEYSALPSKCIVGCIFNSVGLFIPRKSPYMMMF